MELLRDSSPSAETLLRDELAAALRERMDIDFLDPAKTAVADVSPASITNGLTPLTSDGNDVASIREDVRQLVAAFAAANNPPTSGVWIMSAGYRCLRIEKLNGSVKSIVDDNERVAFLVSTLNGRNDDDHH
jgi:hypothetical protein